MPLIDFADNNYRKQVGHHFPNKQLLCTWMSKQVFCLGQSHHEVGTVWGNEIHGTVLESKNTDRVPPGGYEEPAQWTHVPGCHHSWQLRTPWCVWPSVRVSLGLCVPRSPTLAESAHIFTVGVTLGAATQRSRREHLHDPPLPISHFLYTSLSPAPPSLTPESLAPDVVAWETLQGPC